MSRVAAVVAKVAGIVAVVAAIAMTAGAAAPIAGVAWATIAAAASAVSAVSGAVAQATMKPPDMKGTINQIMIGTNMPIPYAVGRTFVGGMMIYDDSAGNKNKDRTQIIVGSAGGPIEQFESFLADFTPISFTTSSGGLISGRANGWYGADGGYLWVNSRKGLRPDTALTAFPGRAAFRNFGSAHKLSGFAAWSVTMEFDEDGKRWSGGIPQWGMVGKWAKAYDPRLDSTYPGGSGSHRWTDESSWEWTDNPALHALAYARGRFAPGGDPAAAGAVRVLGCGLSPEAIDLPAFVALANLAEANGWTCGGVVYDGPGISRWDNLKRLLQPAAARPVWAGGVLTLHYSAPKVALDTVTSADLAGGPVELAAMRGWKERVNTIVPRFRSEPHKWEYVQSAAVSSPTYLAEDGETKSEEVQFDLVQNKDQAAQLAAYELADRREFGPVTITCKPRLMLYRPGEALELDLPEAGLDGQLAVITGRSVDPASGTVTLTLVSETAAKHAWALGKTGTAPPTPTIYDPAEIDDNVSGADQAGYQLLQPLEVRVAADSSGTPSPGQLPRYVVVKLMRGSQDVGQEADWTLATTGGVTASVDSATNRGLVEIAAVTASGTVTVTATVGQVTKQVTFAVTLVPAAPPATGATGGTTASDTSFAPVNSASLAPISDELTVTIGSNGRADLSALLEVTTAAAAPTGTFEVLGRWQWWDGAAWVNLGAADTASDPDATVVFDGFHDVSTGYLNVTASKTGLAPAASEKFRFAVRNAAGTRVMYFSGQASAVGS